jgi:mRNA interferase MazF
MQRSRTRVSNGRGSRSTSFRELEIGDVVLIRFPRRAPHGYEQEGMRPGVIVGLPTNLGIPRFPVVIVAPFTTDRGAPWSYRHPDLYPRFAAGSGSLSADSICLLDQIRAIDTSRVARRWGRLNTQEYDSILNGLLRMISTQTSD